MSISGHNISPSSSDFVPPTYLELEATAAAELPKINLAIVDTLQHPFTEVQKHDLWKYQSAAPRPSLPPAHNIRVSNPDKQADESGAWRGEYQNLVGALPETIQKLLEENQALPREQQFTSLVALDASLVTVARALVIIESGGEPLLLGTSAELHKQMNEQLPQYTDDNYRSAAFEVLGHVKERINDLTPNHPSYDGLNYFAALSEEALGALGEGREK